MELRHKDLSPFSSTFEIILKIIKKKDKILQKNQTDERKKNWQELAVRMESEIQYTWLPPDAQFVPASYCAWFLIHDIKEQVTSIEITSTSP